MIDALWWWLLGLGMGLLGRLADEVTLHPPAPVLPPPVFTKRMTSDLGCRLAQVDGVLGQALGWMPSRYLH